MKIVVCVKHGPDVQSERRLEDERLVRGEDDVLNELDENAVEAAVSLVEEHDGEVVALSMGPQDAEEGLRRALQMGADSAVLVSDEALAGSDVVATARVLAAAIEKIGEVDLVITGMASLDSMSAMLPGALASALDLPALVSVTDQANDPRYPNFAAMRAAKKKPLETWELSDLGIEPAPGVIEMVDAQARPARSGGVIVTDAGEAGKQLATWLVENKLV